MIDLLEPLATDRPKIGIDFGAVATGLLNIENPNRLDGGWSGSMADVLKKYIPGEIDRTPARCRLENARETHPARAGSHPDHLEDSEPGKHSGSARTTGCGRLEFRPFNSNAAMGPNGRSLDAFDDVPFLGSGRVSAKFFF